MHPCTYSTVADETRDCVNTHVHRESWAQIVRTCKTLACVYLKEETHERNVVDTGTDGCCGLSVDNAKTR